MGDTRRSRPADPAASANALRGAVAHVIASSVPAGVRVAVALSGGRDSVALLDATLAACAAAPRDVVALHVDHRLSANANDWAAFCVRLCAKRAVPCHVQSVDVRRGPRISVEAAARTARYAALTRLAREHGAAAVLLAHHADDQAETLLLQLLRGSGPRGLAAMPAATFADGVWWLRPWLAVERARIDAYSTHRALRYVDDDSNAATRSRRNALRHAVVPALRDLAAGYPSTLVRAAELQADAAALLDDLARADACHAYDGSTLDCAALARLDERRARNLVRWFLREQRLPAPPRARLAELVDQLRRSASDAQVAVAHAGIRIAVHRGRVGIHHPPAATYCRGWNGQTTVTLPHGALILERGVGVGIAARHVTEATMSIRSGVDGERLRAAGRPHRRAVADLLRAAGVPAWERRAIPRLYCSESLAAVAGVGVAAEFAAAPGEAGFAGSWHPSTPSR
jgi:tRNA(Ile)-lysidine synthase